MNSIVLYFSRKGKNYINGKIENLKVGNTEVIATKIQELMGCPKFKIEATFTYPEDYYECTVMSKNEHDNNKDVEPGNFIDLSNYDVIYLGYPIWWSTYPKVVETFLKKSNLKKQLIKPFSTHEGSGLGKSVDDLKKLNLNVADGLAIRGSKVNDADTLDALKLWLSK